MAFQIKTRDEILRDLVANYVSQNPDVNDFAPGSTIRSMLEALASSTEETYTQMYLGFRRSLSTIPEEVFELPRKEGVRATVTLTFTKETASANLPITIESGTRVSNTSNIVFATAQSLTIQSTSTTGTIRAVAEDVGSDGTTSRQGC